MGQEFVIYNGQRMVKGWPEQKVVMRAWIISAAAAVLGLAIALLDKTF